MQWTRFQTMIRLEFASLLFLFAAFCFVSFAIQRFLRRFTNKICVYLSNRYWRCWVNTFCPRWEFHSRVSDRFAMARGIVWSDENRLNCEFKHFIVFHHVRFYNVTQRVLEGANANIRFAAATSLHSHWISIFIFKRFVYLFVIFFNDKQFIGIVNAAWKSACQHENESTSRARVSLSLPLFLLFFFFLFILFVDMAFFFFAFFESLNCIFIDNF